MEQRTKFAVYIYVDGDCGGCNKKEKWFYYGVTFDPETFEKTHPGYTFRFKKAVLS